MLSNNKEGQKEKTKRKKYTYKRKKNLYKVNNYFT